MEDSGGLDRDDEKRSKGASKLEKGAQHLKTRAMLFLERTPQGEIAKRVREQLQMLEPNMG